VDNYNGNDECYIWFGSPPDYTYIETNAVGGLGGACFYGFGELVIEPIIEQISEPEYSVTVTTVENGSSIVSKISTNTYTLVATPDDDYAFHHWESRPTSGDEDNFAIDTDATEQGATAAVTLTEDTTYRAVFTRATPKLTGTFALKKTDVVKMPPFAGYNHAKGFWYTKSYTGAPPANPIQAEATSPAQLTVYWDATGKLKPDSENFFRGSEPNETFGKYVDLELWEGESATGTPFYSCEDIVLTAASQGNQDEYWKIAPLNIGSTKYLFEMYFAMPDADKLTFKLTYKDYDKSVISTETLTMDTPHDPAPDTSNIVPITVTMSVEKLTVDGEYIVEPTQIVVPEGSTVAYTLKELLKAAYPDKGLAAYRGQSNYVQGIWDPSYTGSNSYQGYLNEFDFGGASGWKYCQNNVFPTLGIAQSAVRDGDVVRFQYTKAGLGRDLDNRADKDALTKAVVAIRADGAEASYGVNYTNALAVLKTLDASQSAVDEALDALQPIPIVWVTDITDVPATATIGTPLALSGTATPDDATYQTIVWSVKTAGTTGAEITDGVLTATSAGTVTVTAAIANGAETGDFTKDFDITVKTAAVSRPGGNSGGKTPKTSDDAVAAPDGDIPGAVNTFSDVVDGKYYAESVA
jgi:hypothetical protein